MYINDIHCFWESGAGTLENIYHFFIKLNTETINPLKILGEYIFSLEEGQNLSEKTQKTLKGNNKFDFIKCKNTHSP